jgi:hypothetical protein
VIIMLKTKIKPIPKYILARIKKEDKKYKCYGTGLTRFYSYLTKNDGELVKVTVAVKNRYSKWYCKQVAVHGIHSDKCLIKDIVFYYVSGYRVGWYEEGLQKEPKWYESTDWGVQEDKLFDPYAPIMNREYLGKFPEYQYSAVELYKGVDVLKYLRLYEEHPQIEYLMKAGLSGISFSKQILRKAGQDKRFCKWLMKNRSEIARHDYYVAVLLRAYQTGKPLALLQSFHKSKLALQHDQSMQPIRALFKTDLERFFTYIEQQKATAHFYLDYLKACEYLGLNMQEDKNRYPHDFARWHDIRIDEYASAKAMRDEQERADMYRQFAAVAEKYLTMQESKGGYAVLIARSPADLVKEGDALCHCVGSMGYDRKFIREETLIFFVRHTSDIEKPFVTMEYSIESKKILQCYAQSNTKPDERVLDFLHQSWLPYANRKLRKIQRTAA